MSVAVITGASGLLGSNLAAALLHAGHRVRATRRGSTQVEHLADLAIEWVDGDLGEPARLTEAFRGADVVFHCAAQVSVRKGVTPELTAANVTGTEHVVAAVRAAGVPRLVHTSSVVAVGLSTDGRPCTEDAPWNFGEVGLDDGYSITKREAEQRVLDAVAGGLDAVVVNPTYMFGPRDARPSSGKLIVDLARRKVPGWTPGSNNFVDVRDVARGMIAAWQRGRRGERYILGGHNLMYRCVFETIASIAGVSPPRLRVPRPVAAVIGRFGDLRERLAGTEPLVNSTTVRYAFTAGFQFSSDKAAAELGYTFGPIAPAITDAIGWFREHRMVP